MEMFSCWVLALTSVITWGNHPSHCECLDFFHSMWVYVCRCVCAHVCMCVFVCLRSVLMCVRLCVCTPVCVCAFVVVCVFIFYVMRCSFVRMLKMPLRHWSMSNTTTKGILINITAQPGDNRTQRPSLIVFGLTRCSLTCFYGRWLRFKCVAFRVLYCSLTRYYSRLFRFESVLFWLYKKCRQTSVTEMERDPICHVLYSRDKLTVTLVWLVRFYWLSTSGSRMSVTLFLAQRTPAQQHKQNLTVHRFVRSMASVSDCLGHGLLVAALYCRKLYCTVLCGLKYNKQWQNTTYISRLSLWPGHCADWAVQPPTPQYNVHWCFIPLIQTLIERNVYMDKIIHTK